LIKNRSVFVLGAGANVPYGFSTGEGLLASARALSVEQVKEKTCGQLTERQIYPLCRALADNFLPSIDALLEHRTDLRLAGKKLMLSLLLDEEAKAKKSQWGVDEDWMSLVFSQMAEDAATVGAFASNPVSFITFNYDRYLEDRMVRGLVARYAVSEQEAWDAIRRFQFVHVYGSLGELPVQKIGGSPGYAIPFGAPEDPGVSYRGLALDGAEQAISIVHDGEAPRRFAAAHALLHPQTDQIFFFGFAFGRQNVDRLQTRQIPPTTRVFCTVYGMTGAEEHEAMTAAFPQFSRVPGSLIHESKTIRQFLRERILLLR